MALNVKDASGTTVEIAATGDGSATPYKIQSPTVATTGSTAPAAANLVAGTDGTNARALKTDSGGELQVDIVGALPAGTNAIGKLAANSGVDIGDVDITSIAAGTNNIGDVDIAPKTMLYVSGSASSSGDNSLIAAPGAGAIYISTLFVQNTTTTATTALIKNGATEIGRMLNQNQGDGLRLQFPAGREMKLSATTALNLNLSGANAHNYFVTYFVE